MKTTTKLTTEQEIKQIAGRLRELDHNDNNTARYMDEQGVTYNVRVSDLEDKLEDARRIYSRETRDQEERIEKLSTDVDDRDEKIEELEAKIEELEYDNAELKKGAA